MGLQVEYKMKQNGESTFLECCDYFQFDFYRTIVKGFYKLFYLWN